MTPVRIIIPVWSDRETIKVRTYIGHFLRWVCPCGFFTIVVASMKPAACFRCGCKLGTECKHK